MEQQNYINSVNLNKNTNFPYLVLDVVDDNSYPRNPGFQVMHWHEDLQFDNSMHDGKEDSGAGDGTKVATAAWMKTHHMGFEKRTFCTSGFGYMPRHCRHDRNGFLRLEHEKGQKNAGGLPMHFYAET